MGAWIETMIGNCIYVPSASHPVWVRGLKPLAVSYPLLYPLSHPVWVRGLKPLMRKEVKRIVESHLVWVRGLKLLVSLALQKLDSRTPCGCVD